MSTPSEETELSTESGPTAVEAGGVGAAAADAATLAWLRHYEAVAQRRVSVRRRLRPRFAARPRSHRILIFGIAGALAVALLVMLLGARP